MIGILDGYPQLFYGAQHVTALTARELCERGENVVVFAPSEGRFTHWLAENGVAVEVVRAPDSLLLYGGVHRGGARVRSVAAVPGYALRLASRLRKRGVDLLHVNDERGMVLGGVAARLARARLVWAVHSAVSSGAVARAGAALAHVVVVPSQAMADAAPSAIQRRGIRVVPNPVAPQFLEAPAADRSGEQIVVTAGRFHPAKGFDVLLDAMPAVRAQVPGVRLVILGDTLSGHDDYAEQLRRKAAPLGGAVEFAGRVERPESVWRHARVYVQPSREEPFGMSALEAMATGLPVVATRSGGLVEVVADGVTGILVPPNDARALADAIVRVLTDTALADAYATAGRTRAREQFTLARTVDDMQAVYAGARRR